MRNSAVPRGESASAYDERLFGPTTAALATVVARQAVEEARRGDRLFIRQTRRRRSKLVLGGTTLAVAGSIGVAAAASWSAHTGVFGKPGFTENDTSEYLSTSAPDFPMVLRQLQPTDLTLPARHDFAPFVMSTVSQIDARNAASAKEGRPGDIEQVTLVKGQYVLYALCVWENNYLDASSLGDSAEADVAAQQMSQLAEAPELAAIDREGGVRAHQRALALAAEQGQVNVVRQSVSLECGADSR